MTTAGFSFELHFRLGNPSEGAGMLYQPATKSFLKKQETKPGIFGTCPRVKGAAKYFLIKRLLKTKSGKAEPKPEMH